MQNRSILFWLDWPRPHRIIFLLTLAGLCLAITAMWWSYSQTPGPTFTLQTIQDAELLEIPVHRFQKGIFELAVVGNNYVVFERLLGSPIEVPTSAAYAFVFFLLFSVPLLLAVFTTLSRFYYLVCMGIFILFIASLRLEALQLFGQTNKVPTVILLSVYVLTSFYLFYFLKSVTFLQRYLIFVLITFGFALVVYFFSGVSLPFLHLAANGITAGIVICVLFILLVAHEILAAFIFIVTQGARPSKSLQHFFVISLVYMLNLALAYAIRFKFIRWDLFVVDLFLLLTLSGILGIWGIRQRQKQFDGILDVEPYGTMGFVALACVAFASLNWFFQSANDPVISALSDIIIFSHIGFGLIFLLYVISNFIAMLAKNMAVHKVLYNPNNMPYFTFRFGGLIATLAFAFYNAWQVPVYNAIAGYHLAAGDLHLALGDNELAKAFYDRSIGYGYGNHHGNYALANLEGARMNTRAERLYYETASSRRPTEMSVLNWAQTYQTDQNNLRALVTLKEGSKELPDNGALTNSIGYLFWRSGVNDSAQFYFRKAAATDASRLAETNLMAMGARLKADPEQTDTLASNDLLEYLPYRANLMARFNSVNKKWRLGFSLPQDTTLDRASAAWLNNYLINPYNELDTTTLKKLTTLAKRPSNEAVREPLLFALALAHYKAGDVRSAYQLLEEVTIISPDQQGKYNNVLALWTLEQHESQRALGYLSYALNQNYPAARLTHAVVLTESNMLNEAVVAWDSLHLSGRDSTTLLLASRMKNLLALPARQVFLLSDEDKYAFARYRVSLADSAFFQEIVSSISTPDFKAKTLLERSQLLLEADRLQESIAVFEKIRGLELSNKNIYDDIRHHELMLLGVSAEWATLEERLKQNISFALDKKKNKVFFDALLAESKGDTARATPLFHWLGTANPFFEEGVMAAARYFQTHGTDRLLPYNLLVESIQFHPEGLKVRKAYCLEAARIGFLSYATDSIEELKRKLPPAEFEAFRKTLDEVLASRAEE